MKREREIREFVKTPFYRLVANVGEEGQTFDAEWKAVKGTKYFESPLLYKENGFKNVKNIHAFMKSIQAGTVGRKRPVKEDIPYEIIL